MSTTSKIFPLNLTNNTDKLKQLIVEHPDYPIVVLCGEEANCGGDYYWMFCTDVGFSVGELLDCEQPWNAEYVATDKDEFEERLEEWLWEQMHDNGLNPSEEDFQIVFEEEKNKYNPYWKNVIQIRCDN